MPVALPSVSKVYHDQMTTLSHGLALWDPNPLKDIYDNVLRQLARQVRGAPRGFKFTKPRSSAEAHLRMCRALPLARIWSALIRNTATANILLEDAKDDLLVCRSPCVRDCFLIQLLDVLECLPYLPSYMPSYTSKGLEEVGQEKNGQDDKGAIRVFGTKDKADAVWAYNRW